jgi:segregation and condensation protein A
MAGLNVQLNTFEGPLSLLLYLIKKDELDIYDIPVNEITQQYLEYIKIMKELNLEVAGEFVAMAATLIYIKSRMLVPQYDENGQEIEDDPRKELVQKLLEYQKFQEAGKLLYKRPLLGREIWLRGTKEEFPKADEEIVLDDKGLFALIAVFRDLMKEATDTKHQVHGKGMSISSRLLQIKSKFTLGSRIEFKDLLEPNFSKVELLLTFLCILELSRMGFTRIYQTEPFAPIHIETIKTVTSEVVHRVQEFDAADSELQANRIMKEASENLNEMSLSDEAQSHVEVKELELDPEVQAVEAGDIA